MEAIPRGLVQQLMSYQSTFDKYWEVRSLVEQAIQAREDYIRQWSQLEPMQPRHQQNQRISQQQPTSQAAGGATQLSVRVPSNRYRAQQIIQSNRANLQQPDDQNNQTYIAGSTMHQPNYLYSRIRQEKRQAMAKAHADNDPSTQSAG